MPSQAYHDWVNAGRPDSGLALPLVQLRDVLRADGWLVYDWPDDSHLLADPPEDHTQFSATGWPKPSPRWWRHAIDVMPDGKGANALYDLGQRLVDDRQTGRITWLKYINRPDVRGSLATARQDAWESSHVQRRSSDAGHLHLSSITGVETTSSPYNPLGVTPAAAMEESVMFVAQQTTDTVDGSPYGKGTVFLCTGTASYPLTLKEYQDLQTLAGPGPDGGRITLAGGSSPRAGWYPAPPFGYLPVPGAPTVDQIVDGIKAALPADGGTVLTTAALTAAAEEGVKAAFRAAAGAQA